MKLKLLLLFLNFLPAILWAQTGAESEQELPRWQSGLDISTPLLLQFDNYAGWDRAFLLDGLVQYRTGQGIFWPQMYVGYFAGNKALTGAGLKQRGFYLKPGMMIHLGRGAKTRLFFELNAVFSGGPVKQELVIPDPLFGDVNTEVKQKINGYGAEAGFGGYVADYKAFRLRLSVVGFLADYGGTAKLRYLAGAGNLTERFPFGNYGGAIRLHLLMKH